MSFGGSGGGSSSIATSTDVLLSGPTNNQVLTYDSGDAKWKNANPSGGSEPVGEIELDSFSGASDDDKLTAAMAYAQAQTRPPMIRLAARNHTFTQKRNLYDGFGLIGAPGIGMAEQGGSAGTNRTYAYVNIAGGGVWLTPVAGASGRCTNVSIIGINFNGDQNTQFMGGNSIVMWYMLLRDTSFARFSSILGSQSTKLLLLLCLIDGWQDFNMSYSGAIHIGGSDNNLFMNGANIDSTADRSTNANGQFHLWLDWMSKTYIGPIYVTCEAGWGGIRVDGPADPATGGSSGNAGPNWINGARIEGRNKDAPCNGSVMRVYGGIASLSDCWVGYGMASPATMGHSPQDAGMIHQTGGILDIAGLTYDRATGVAETVPLVYQSGGEAMVQRVMRGSQGGAWTGRPRRSGSNFTVSDATTQSA